MTAMVTAPAPAIAKSGTKVRTAGKVRTISVEELAAISAPGMEGIVLPSAQSRQLSFIREITGFNDTQLGEVFPGTVTRESVSNGAVISSPCAQPTSTHWASFST